MTQLKIYVPREADGFADADAHVRRRMSANWGGFTAYDGRGGWMNADGELVEEPVRVFETLTAAERAGELESVGIGIARDVKELTDESAVMLAVGGKKHMVTEGHE